MISTAEHEQAKQVLEISEELSAELSTEALGSLLGKAAVLAPDGRILAVNDAWRSTYAGANRRLEHTGLGQNYLNLFRRPIAGGDEYALEALVGLLNVLRGTVPQFLFDCTGSKSRWRRFTATARDNEHPGALISCTEISDVPQPADEFSVGNRIPTAPSSSLFFHALVKSLAKVLQVKHAFVADIVDTERKTCRIIAHWNGSRFADFETLNLTDTLYEQIVSSESIVYRSSVRQHFSTDPWLRDMAVDGYAGVPILDSQGIAIGHLAIAHDQPLTENVPLEPVLRFFAARSSKELEHIRKETERDSLLERALFAEAHYRALFEGIADPVLVVDDQGHFVDVNEAATAILGYSREEVLEMGLSDLAIEDAGWAEFPKMMREGHWEGQTHILCKDGGSIRVEVRATTANIPEGREFVAVFHNLTALKNGEEEQREPEDQERRRALGRVESTVEHQILHRNPYKLTLRELIVLQLVADGVSNKEIAHRLSISIFTVHKHVANILGKMQATSRTEAAVRAQREGLTE